MAMYEFEADEGTGMAARRLSVWNESIAQSLSRNPKKTLETVVEWAANLAAHETTREAMGEASLATAGSDIENFQYGVQLASLAKGIVALARASGEPARGAAWGAFSSVYKRLPAEQKALVLSDSQMQMNGVNPTWAEALGNQVVAEGFAKSEDLPDVKLGSVKAPAEPPSEAEARFASEIGTAQRVVLTSVLRLDEDFAAVQGPKDEVEASRKALAEETFRIARTAIAGVVAKTSAEEVRQGVEWRHMPKSERFRQASDDGLINMGMSLAAMAGRAGIDPSSDPKMLATMGSLVARMSTQKAFDFIGWMSGMPGGADLGGQWKAFGEQLAVKNTVQWKAGLAIPREQFAAASRPEVLVEPSEALAVYVEPVFSQLADIGTAIPASGATAADKAASMDSPSPFSSALYDVGFGLGEAAKFGKRMAAGIVDAFSSKGSLSRHAESAVDKANHLTDSAQEKLVEVAGLAKEKAQSAIHAGARGLDSAIETAMGSAKSVVDGVVGAGHGAKAAFVGKVGELQHASSVMAGSSLLSLADKIPKVEGKEPLSPQAVAFLQVAALTSGIMMGAVAAPVIGPLALVGGALAGLGAWVAGKNAAAELKSGVSVLPSALESIGSRLGAKRAEKAAFEPVGPTLGSASPSM